MLTIISAVSEQTLFSRIQDVKPDLKRNSFLDLVMSPVLKVHKINAEIFEFVLINVTNASTNSDRERFQISYAAKSDRDPLR